MANCPQIAQNGTAHAQLRKPLIYRKFILRTRQGSNLRRSGAHRLPGITGRGSDFLGNQLEDPSADPIEVRKRFSEAQEGLPSAVERSEYIEGNFPDGYMATLIPMAVLLRLLILQRLIARELGYSGCRHTGFFDMVVKMNLRLLGRVPNPRTRRRLFQESKDIVGMGMEKVTSVVMGDCQEILSAVREIKADSVKSRRKPIRLHPANPSVAKALKKAGSRNRLFGVGNYHPQDCGSNPKTRSS